MFEINGYGFIDAINEVILRCHRTAVVVIVWKLYTQLPVQSVHITTKVVSSKFRSWRGVPDAILGDKVWQLLASGWWFSQGTPVFSIDKTDSHGIAKILLKLALSTTTIIRFLRVCSNFLLQKVKQVYMVNWTEITYFIL
jgi:hypothetical protein